jgi:hypothetical protein
MWIPRKGVAGRKRKSAGARLDCIIPADVQTALMNVRFEGNNGHDADVARCLLMTQSGHRSSRTEAGSSVREKSEIESKRLNRRLWPLGSEGDTAEAG